MGWGGGLLHSHVQTYPVGSNQQQVTCYHYKDNNNEWVLLPRWDEPPLDINGPLKFLKDGDVIRIQHAPTTRNLHSHNVPAPVTKLNNEVSCYGNATVGDYHDYWRVEVVDDLKQGRKDKVQRIHSLTTRLRFRHEKLGCYLRAANAILPEWGFKQVEVSCIKEDSPNDVHTYWNVESHWNERCKSRQYTLSTMPHSLSAVPPGDATFYKSPFLRDFWHLNVAMMTSNNALIPDPDKEDILASAPTDWPFLHLGLRMCGWGDQQIKYYLLGTPIIWWAGATSLIVSLIMLVVYLVRQQRKYKDFEPGQFVQFRKCILKGFSSIHRGMGTLPIRRQGRLCWLDAALFPLPYHGSRNIYTSLRKPKNCLEVHKSNTLNKPAAHALLRSDYVCAPRRSFLLVEPPTR